MKKDCGFNTGLLHAGSQGFPQNEILPPVSQVSAFEYGSMEELNRLYELLERVDA